MNTAKLKTFAQQSRRILISGVEQRMLYWGFDEKGKSFEEPKAVAGGIIHRGAIIDDPHALQMWKSLKNAVLKNGYNHIVEEASYTWFNRIMALKILAENGYEQPQVDYGDDGLETPEILRKARAGNYTFLDKNSSERLKLILNDYDQEYNAFAILLEGYCHNNSLIRRVFGLLNDFTGLLIPSNILEKNGFIHLLNTSDSITEEDYRKVELIGWLYQFYISEKKDEVFKKFKKNQKAEAEDIPAATQIFTPNWIVKYMVQNTVGQIWLDFKPDSQILGKMEYLVQSDKKRATGNQQLITEVAHLKLLDPACGSGHILVEGFDLLYEMYLEEYYNPSEAVESILKNNLFGLDIDLRAVQLARFAVLLKAATKDPDILKIEILPEIYSMPEPDPFTKQEVIDFLGKDDKEHIDKLVSSLDLMQQAQNLGSIMVFDNTEELKKLIIERSQYFLNKTFKTTSEEIIFIKIQPFLKVLILMSNHYEAIATNPPYMGKNSMNNQLKEYVFEYYPLTRNDLFAVFFENCLRFTTESGFLSLITQQSWMFISTFSLFREWLIPQHYIKSLVHLGLGVFKELNTKVVQSTMFTLIKGMKPNINGQYLDLASLKQTESKEIHFNDKNRTYYSSQPNFLKIPGSPIAYWADDKTFTLFLEKKISDYSTIFQGMITGNNDKYVRYWFEVSNMKLNLGCRDFLSSSFEDKYWVPYNKGGESVKWYGNQEYVVNFKRKGKDFTRGKHQFSNYFFKPNVSWSYISLSLVARYFPEGFIWDVSGSSLFPNEERFIEFFTALLTSAVGNHFLKILNPTLNYQVENIAAVPVKLPDDKTFNRICTLTKFNIQTVKELYNNEEMSWNIDYNSLLSQSNSFFDLLTQTTNRINKSFYQIHANEEELNRLYIELYELNDYLDPTVRLKDITLAQNYLDKGKLGLVEKELHKNRYWKLENGKWRLYLNNIITPINSEMDLPSPMPIIDLPIKNDQVAKQFISFGLGCIFGRYSINMSGLHIASPDILIDRIYPNIYKNANKDDPENVFKIDQDGLVPVLGIDSLFSDDIVIRFKHFVEEIWGHEHLTANINLIEECLGEDIERYFINDFWSDHLIRFGKHPIFWLFSSKNGAFQLLAYMHRMNKFTVEKVRNNYLIKHIQYLIGQINLLEPRQADLSKQDTKNLDKFRISLRECEEYDMLLKDVADQQIEFDLDDGVKVNYAKFGKVLAEIK